MTFTIDEITDFLKKALSETQYADDPNATFITNEMNKAWNRGAFSMFNHALIEMYQYKKEVSA